MKKFFSSKEEGEERERAAEAIFNRPRKSLSDIVPADKKEVVTYVEEEEVVTMKKKTQASTAPRYEEPPTQLEEEEEVEEMAPLPRVDTHAARDAYEDDVVPESVSSRKKWRRLTILATLIGLVAIGGFLGVYVLPSADISVTLKRTPWEYKGEVTALLANGDISAQLFNQTKNLQLSFAASGKKYIESKAKGTLHIWNAYSSEPQGLVASTRFETPDGKVYRLDKSITVPGAKIVDGKITPSSIDAAVTADKVGTEYNIGPIGKFTIPGFKGSPKFDGFYGASDQPMTGGNAGQTAFPTDADLKSAKEEAAKAIKDSLAAAFQLQIPKDFTILGNGDSVTITKETPLTDTDSENKFKYFIEATDQRIAVRPDDILNFLVGKARAELGNDFKVDTKDLKFEVKQVITKSDGTVNGATLDVAFAGNFVHELNVDDLKTQIAGKSEDDLKELILGLPAVEKAKIYLWPFWVLHVPANAAKINVTVE